jgi:hypothetical protein
MKKGSNWCNTWRTIKEDKDIRHLDKKIREILGRRGEFDGKIENESTKIMTSASIIHYLLNYWEIKRRL